MNNNNNNNDETLDSAICHASLTELYTARRIWHAAALLTVLLSSSTNNISNSAVANLIRFHTLKHKLQWKEACVLLASSSSSSNLNRVISNDVIVSLLDMISSTTTSSSSSTGATGTSHPTLGELGLSLARLSKPSGYALSNEAIEGSFELTRGTGSWATTLEAFFRLRGSRVVPLDSPRWLQHSDAVLQKILIKDFFNNHFKTSLDFAFFVKRKICRADPIAEHWYELVRGLHHCSNNNNNNKNKDEGITKVTTSSSSTTATTTSELMMQLMRLFYKQDPSNSAFQAALQIVENSNNNNINTLFLRTILSRFPDFPILRIGLNQWVVRDGHYELLPSIVSWSHHRQTIDTTTRSAILDIVQIMLMNNHHQSVAMETLEQLFLWMVNNKEEEKEDEDDLDLFAARLCHIISLCNDADTIIIRIMINKVIHGPSVYRRFETHLRPLVMMSSSKILNPSLCTLLMDAQRSNDVFTLLAKQKSTGSFFFDLHALSTFIQKGGLIYSPYELVDLISTATTTTIKDDNNNNNINAICSILDHALSRRGFMWTQPQLRAMIADALKKRCCCGENNNNNNTIISIHLHANLMYAKLS
eukprot:PhM_4_TR14144/c2_g1_i1/m.104266